jgi:hypothetical protein
LLLASPNVARRPIRSGTRDGFARRIETAAYFFHTELPFVAVNKDAFPTSPARVAGRIKSVRLPKQAQVSSVILQAQYQAFVHFAVESSAAFFAIALKGTCVLEPFTQGGLSFESLQPRSVSSYGASNPGPMFGRNVVAPVEYSKCFFRIPMGRYRGGFRPATALGMPARSAFGDLSDVKPEADIKSAIGPLCPRPASTISVPPGASRRAASGTIAR